ncbi:MAG: ATP-dependent DNA helicase [Eubacteriales bacterium]
MTDTVSIAVRALVEFILREGDIDNRAGGYGDAIEGGRLHRKLQKEGGEDCRAELTLRTSRDFGDYELRVEGRADGVLTSQGRTVLDEIKTVALPLEYINEDYSPLHWAQAMVYAYIYASQNGHSEMDVRLTYCQLETEQVKRFVRTYSFQALEIFFLELTDKYRRWSDFTYRWRNLRDPSIRQLSFPFPSYRAGQRELALSVYRTVRDGSRLFAQAPTGIGKTLSTLFPAIKALGEGKVERIFYLTAKTITRQVAQDSCVLMRDKGLRLKSVTLTAKEKICFTPSHDCNPDACPYAKGHYDRINDAMFDLLNANDIMTREAVEEYARRHTVCPFELSLDMSLWSECIIGDYNYVFDPRVYLRRFFGDFPGNYTFLVDEAHNLVDRAREMFSCEVKKTLFHSLYKQADKKSALRSALSAVNKAFIKIRQDCGEERKCKREQPCDELREALGNLLPVCEEWMKHNPSSPIKGELMNAFFEAFGYIRTLEVYDERFVTMVELDGSEVSVRLFCVDPSALLDQAMKRGKSAVLFSATLTPLSYFSAILGGSPDSARVSLPSPFPRERLCLVVSSSISTKFRDRQSSAYPIAEQIAQAVSSREGNYMVYFPSYTYMNEVYGHFSASHPEVRTLVQQTGMDEAAREGFLSMFNTQDSGTLVGFCVLGGIFSEGIDLCGERLIGSIIVGVGLPQISFEQEVIKEHFDWSDGCGFKYAYQYPGMNKVLQAAGRVIRGMEDTGVVVLIDERFVSPAYTSLYPAHWKGWIKVRSGEELKDTLTDFWRERDEVELIEG